MEHDDVEEEAAAAAGVGLADRTGCRDDSRNDIGEKDVKAAVSMSFSIIPIYYSSFHPNIAPYNMEFTLSHMTPI